MCVCVCVCIYICIYKHIHVVNTHRLVSVLIQIRWMPSSFGRRNLYIYVYIYI